jgi:FMN-dependent oxidoreductase (nitrilotriacetate monooxygenase family)
VPRSLRLGLFLYPAGHHIAAWRHPDVPTDAAINLDYYIALARKAEAAGLDFLFMADGLGMRLENIEAMSRIANRHVSQLDPMVLLPVLSAVTQNIGLVATASTTYNEPYHIARRFASLDHVSSGRAGWNVVTSLSDAEARNFGFDQHMDHGLRYERAAEFIAVVKGLWDSWTADAFVRDKRSGRFFEPDGMRVLDHHGKYFRVSGPLNLPRTPQGHPLIFQAGSSDRGRALAARTADAIFVGQQALDPARAFYADIKTRAAEAGRNPDDVLVMPGIVPFVGSSRAEAEDRHAGLQDLIHPVVGLAQLQIVLGGADLSGLPLDGPLPPLSETNGSRGTQSVAWETAERENLTIRQLISRFSGNLGQRHLVGTADDIADELEAWFTGGAADGFNLVAPILPGSLDDFTELVLPALRRRGLFDGSYRGSTLRERLGLPAVPSPGRSSSSPSSSGEATS